MGNLRIGAMIGVCVCDPKLQVTPPADVRARATKALEKKLPDASLSTDAKTEFTIVPSASSLEESARQVWSDLPQQMQNFMIRNHLDPTNYDIQSLSEDIPSTSRFRIFWAAAVAKPPATPHRVGATSMAPATPYSVRATNKTRALIIYLLDVSQSMGYRMGNRPRIDVVAQALQTAVQRMVFRAAKGAYISDRYELAILAYSDDVEDLLGGIKTVGEIAKVGIPRLSPQSRTNTAKAFAAAEKLLLSVWPKLQTGPAPLICHMTDGEYNGPDPEPVVRRIMGMRVADGEVLVENIFISDTILDRPIGDPKKWPGILPDTPLSNDYAIKLRSMSSPLPSSYRVVMREYDYELQEGAVMLLPGVSPELVELGFQMSASTPFSR